jgi:hypothetical protein
MELGAMQFTYFSLLLLLLKTQELKFDLCFIFAVLYHMLTVEGTIFSNGGP